MILIKNIVLFRVGNDSFVYYIRSYIVFSSQKLILQKFFWWSSDCHYFYYLVKRLFWLDTTYRFTLRV